MNKRLAVLVALGMSIAALEPWAQTPPAARQLDVLDQRGSGRGSRSAEPSLEDALRRLKVRRAARAHPGSPRRSLAAGRMRRVDLASGNNGGTCGFFMLLQSDPAMLNQYQAQVSASDWAQSSSYSAGIDPLSADCVECHDGVLASDVPVLFQSVPNSPANAYNHSTRYQNHPIGMNYAYSSLSPALRKREQLPGNMRFIDSKVGCLSCHDPLNNQVANNLAVGNEGSGLCLTCHIK